MLSVPTGLACQPRPPLTARYRVLFTPVDARDAAPPAAEWLYLRDDTQVRLDTGDGVQRVWRRAAGGTVHLHASAPGVRRASDALLQAWRGEPAPTDWDALTSFIGAGDLRRLEADPAPQRQPGHTSYTLRSAGLLDLLWDTARQLPLRMTRLLPTGTLSHTLLSVEAAA